MDDKNFVDAMDPGIKHKAGFALVPKINSFAPLQRRWNLLYRSSCGCGYSCNRSYYNCCNGCSYIPLPPPPCYSCG
ncbi:unnamed protein product, partial [Larinioides sclopetarius]